MEVWGSNKGLKLCIWQIFCRGSYFECDLHCEVKWIDSFEVINCAGGRLTARNFTFLVLLRLVVNRGVWSGRYGVLPVVKWYIGETPTWEFYGFLNYLLFQVLISGSILAFRSIGGDKQHLTSVQYLFLREIFYKTQLIINLRVTQTFGGRLDSIGTGNVQPSSSLAPVECRPLRVHQWLFHVPGCDNAQRQILKRNTAYTLIYIHIVCM